MKKLATVVCIMLFITPAMVIADDLLYYQPACTTISDYTFVGADVWVAGLGSLVRWREDGSYTQYTTQDGLPSNNLITVFADHRDDIWVGTSKGLAKYNGWTFIIYNTENSEIPHDVVLDIEQDQNGNMWIATRAGISMFDGTDWVTTLKEEFGLEEAYQEIDIAPDNSVWLSNYSDDYDLHMAVFKDGEWTLHDRETLGLSPTIASHTRLNVRNSAFDNKGNLWISTHRGLLKYDGESWEYAEDYTLTGMCITSDDRVLVSGSNGLREFKDGAWSDYGDLELDDNNDVFMPGLSSDGELWYMVRNLDSFYLESYADGIRTPHFVDGPRKYAANDMFIDSKDNLWVVSGFSDSAVYLLDDSGWHYFSVYDIFDNSSMSDGWETIFEDPNGAVFFLSDQGVASYDDGEWRSWLFMNLDASGVLPGFAEKCALDEFNFGENGPFYSYKDGVWNRFYAENRYIPWYGAFDADGTLWCAAEGNLCSYDGSEWTYYPEYGEEITGYVYKTVIDPSGVKWISSSDGLFSFDGDEVVAYDREDDLFTPAMDLMDKDQSGRVWTFHQPYFSVNDGTGWVTYDLGDIQEPSWMGTFTMCGDNELWISDNYGTRCYDITVFPKVAPVSVEEVVSVPAPFELIGNYPNPFNPSTTISFTLEKGGYTELSVYNSAGQKIRDLITTNMTAGKHSAVWNGRDNHDTPVSSGVYIIKLGQDDRVVGSRMTLVK